MHPSHSTFPTSHPLPPLLDQSSPISASSELNPVVTPICYNIEPIVWNGHRLTSNLYAHHGERRTGGSRVPHFCRLLLYPSKIWVNVLILNPLKSAYMQSAYWFLNCTIRMTSEWKRFFPKSQLMFSKFKFFPEYSFLFGSPIILRIGTVFHCLYEVFARIKNHRNTLAPLPSLFVENALPFITPNWIASHFSPNANLNKIPSSRNQFSSTSGVFRPIFNLWQHFVHHWIGRTLQTMRTTTPPGKLAGKY